MDDLTALERQVADEIVRIVGPARPVDDATVVETATSHPRKWALPSLFSATKFAVAGVIVALFGGFLLAGLLTTQPSDESLPVGASPSPPATVVPTRIDPSSVAVTNVVEIGREPIGPIEVDAGAIWVAEPKAVNRIDPVTLEVTDRVPLDGANRIRWMIPTEDSIWVAKGNRSEIWTIDTTTLEVSEAIGGARSEPIGLLAVEDGAMWITRGERPTVLSEIDLDDGSVRGEYPMPSGLAWAEAVDETLWLFTWDGPWELWAFDLATRELEGPYELLPTHPMDECCVVGEGAIWFARTRDTQGRTQQNSRVERFDLVTRKVDLSDTILLGKTTEHSTRTVWEGIAEAGAIWMLSSGEVSVLFRIDPDTRSVADVIPMGTGRSGPPMAADGAIWVPLDDGTLARVDTETRQLTHTIPIGDGVGVPVAIEGAILVPSDGHVTRIATE